MEYSSINIIFDKDGEAKQNGLMGEIAEDMVRGRCCSLCNCYFVKNGEVYTHECPVVCRDCWDNLNDEDKLKYDMALENTF